MPITYVIKFEVVPGERARFLTLLAGVLDAMREEAAFHEAVLHQDPDSQYRFMLYETWESHEDVVTVQLDRPYRQQWHEALPELLSAPREVAVWMPLRSDRNTGGSASQEASLPA